jgi:hypothetical protein
MDEKPYRHVDRIAELEAALRAISEFAIEAGNEPRHTAGERSGARMVGVKIRSVLVQLGIS